MQIESLAVKSFWKFVAKITNFIANTLHLRSIISELVFILLKTLVCGGRRASCWLFRFFLFLFLLKFFLSLILLILFLIVIFLIFWKLLLLVLNFLLRLRFILFWVFWGFWVGRINFYTVRTNVSNYFDFCLFSGLFWGSFFRSLLTVNITKPFL